MNNARHTDPPSMKVPPKRKGNGGCMNDAAVTSPPLNESPSEKEGKWGAAMALVVMKGIPQ